MFLLVFAALMAQVDDCASAVHTDLPSAPKVCDPGDAKIDIFSPGGMTDSCLSALKSGKKLGEIGPRLPVVARNSLTAEFDKRIEACRHPKKDEPTPTRDITQIWD